MIDYSRQILALNDTELEKIVREWIERKKSQYVKVERFSGPGDKGRDVVGFVTTKYHEGLWDNYQCKQYGRNLGTAEALLELGKIFYYCAAGEFTLPRTYFFVAPRGVNRNLGRLFFNPTAFRKALIDHWPEYCQPKIIQGGDSALTDAITTLIESYDFSNVQQVSLDALIANADFKPLLVKWFGADPGPAPKGKIPAQIGQSELSYVNQLVDAYSERNKAPFTSHADVEKHETFGAHLRRQRERFFDADAFLRFYRDNTSPDTIDEFNHDIYHGVIETHEKNYPDALDRVDAVMTQAAVVHPSGPLASHARVPVKQGVCHHFANDDKLKWKK